MMPAKELKPREAAVAGALLGGMLPGGLYSLAAVSAFCKITPEAAYMRLQRYAHRGYVWSFHLSGQRVFILTEAGRLLSRSFSHHNSIEKLELVSLLGPIRLHILQALSYAPEGSLTSRQIKTGFPNINNRSVVFSKALSALARDKHLEIHRDLGGIPRYRLAGLGRWLISVAHLEQGLISPNPPLYKSDSPRGE